MKNKTMNELGFRIMWRIMQISEDVIHRNIFLNLQNSSSYSVSLNNYVTLRYVTLFVQENVDIN